MRKIAILIILLLFCTACSNETKDNSKNTGETSVAREENSVEDTSEKNEDTPIVRPSSDITGGDDLGGTWVDESDGETSLVLALNSDHSFEFYEEVKSSKTSGSALGSGTYSIEDGSLIFVFNQTEDNFNGESHSTIFQENTVFKYELQDNKLVLTAADGKSYQFQRE